MSRVPKTLSSPSGFAETAGVKAKSREHVRAEGHPEEGKRDPTAPAPTQPGPRPGDVAGIEEQPVRTPARSPLPPLRASERKLLLVFFWSRKAT